MPTHSGGHNSTAGDTVGCSISVLRSPAGRRCGRGLVDTPVLYWINGIGCAIFAGLAGRCIPADVCRRTESGLRACTAMSKVGYRQALSDKRLVLLAVSGLATLTTLMGFFAAVPMLMSASGLGVGAYGWVQLINALAVVAVTPLLTPWLSKQLASLVHGQTFWPARECG